MVTNMCGLHEQTYTNGEVVQGKIVFNTTDTGDSRRYADNLSAKELVELAKEKWQFMVDNELENWDVKSKPTTLAKAIRFLDDMGYEITLGFVGKILDKEGNEIP